MAEPALQIDDIAPVPFDTDRESFGSEEDSSSCETFYHPPLSDEHDDEEWMAWRERIDELLEEFGESEETEAELGEEEQIREEEELRKSE